MLTHFTKLFLVRRIVVFFKSAVGTVCFFADFAPPYISSSIFAVHTIHFAATQTLTHENWAAIVTPFSFARSTGVYHTALTTQGYIASTTGFYTAIKAKIIVAAVA